jgi:hypothetical protein
MGAELHTDGPLVELAVQLAVQPDTLTQKANATCAGAARGLPSYVRGCGSVRLPCAQQRRLIAPEVSLNPASIRSWLQNWLRLVVVSQLLQRGRHD